MNETLLSPTNRPVDYRHIVTDWPVTRGGLGPHYYYRFSVTKFYCVCGFTSLLLNLDFRSDLMLLLLLPIVASHTQGQKLCYLRQGVIDSLVKACLLLLLLVFYFSVGVLFRKFCRLCLAVYGLLHKTLYTLGPHNNYNIYALTFVCFIYNNATFSYTYLF